MIAFLVSLLIRGYDNDTKDTIEQALRAGYKPGRNP